MYDPVIVYGGVALLAGLVGVVGSYALKAYQDPDLKFDWAYAGGLVIQVIVAVGSIVPKDATEITLGMLWTVFVAGLGLQGVINKGITVGRNAQK